MSSDTQKYLVEHLGEQARLVLMNSVMHHGIPEVPLRPVLQDAPDPSPVPLTVQVVSPGAESPSPLAQTVAVAAPAPQAVTTPAAPAAESGIMSWLTSKRVWRNVGKALKWAAILCGIPLLGYIGSAVYDFGDETTVGPETPPPVVREEPKQPEVLLGPPTKEPPDEKTGSLLQWLGKEGYSVPPSKK